MIKDIAIVVVLAVVSWYAWHKFVIHEKVDSKISDTLNDLQGNNGNVHGT